VRNNPHQPGAYLAAFSSAGLGIRGCHDLVYREEELELVASRLDLARDVAAKALVGLPAVIVWDLARA